jgi:hypothetical protein
MVCQAPTSIRVFGNKTEAKEFQRSKMRLILFQNPSSQLTAIKNHSEKKAIGMTVVFSRLFFTLQTKMKSV